MPPIVEILKMRYLLLLFLWISSATAADVTVQSSAKRLEAYDCLELTIERSGFVMGNPFDIQVQATFSTDSGEHLIVSGFCDDAEGKTFRIRYMPRVPGVHRYIVNFEGKEIETGEVYVTPSRRRGPVRVDSKFPHHFIYDNTGEHYFWNGTTTYWLMGVQDDEKIKAAIDRLAKLKVNRIRLAINARTTDGSRWYEPEVKNSKDFQFRIDPWPNKNPGDPKKPEFDLTRFEVAFWQKLDRLVSYARSKDVQVSVIFYLDGADPGVDPFGKGQKSWPGSDQEERYYRYAASRLAAYPNIMWDITNEWHLFRNEAWVGRMGKVLRGVDPYAHIMSVHGRGDFPFYRSPWADFALYQKWDEQGGYQFLRNARDLATKAGKRMPQINEEYGYEDHYPGKWGGGRKKPARTADTRRRLAWEMAMAGGYQTTGERANEPGQGGWLTGLGNDNMTMLTGYGHMVDFFTSFEWWRLNPVPTADSAKFMFLADQPMQYVAYFPNGGSAILKLPSEEYQARWFNPRTGEWRESVNVAAGEWSAITPDEAGDWAVYLKAKSLIAREESFFEAARKGEVEIIKQLLDEGVSPDARSEYGATAMHFAADKGHVAIVKLLLERGANPSLRDKFYSATPSTWASMRSQWGVLVELVKVGGAGADSTVQAAAKAGNMEAVKSLIQQVKYTPATLSAAAKSATNKEIVEVLVAAGAARPEKTAEAAKKPATKSKKATDDDKAMTQPDVVDPVPNVRSHANWPQFRGVGAAGVADGQFPPTTFDVPKGKNVRWKTPIPGLGHACPVIWGDQVFLTTAVGSNSATLKPGQYGDVDSVKEDMPHEFRVICLNRHTGSIIWNELAHKGVPKVKRHLKSTHANSTVATDGKHLIASFGAEGLFCYDMQGKLLWKRDLGPLDSGWFFDPEYQWGFGSSPVIHEDRVLVQCDAGKNSFLVAYQITDGKELWKTPRDEPPSWGSPTVVRGPDRVEVVCTGTKFARSYDVVTGKELWRVGRLSEISVPTPFVGKGLIFVCSGYRPVMPIFAIKPGSTGDLSLKDGKSKPEGLAWSARTGGPYLPTPIVYGDHLYVLANSGMLTCYEATTGKKIYSERVGGSSGFTAALTAADGRIYCVSETNGVRVVKAGPTFELLAVNLVGETCMSTPAICDGVFFLRTEKHLIALGVPKKQTGIR
jgi:outer membrane protein assembly factor BamB